MRPREDEIIDPEIAEQLDAIDATLAGEPVEPRFAELAELALMLAAERPEGPSAELAASLDARVAERFGRGRGGASGRADVGAGVTGAGRRGRRWSSLGLMPALGLGATAVVAVVVAVSVLGSGGGGGALRPGQVVRHGAKEGLPAVPAGGVTVASSAAPGRVKAAPSSVNGTAGGAGAGTHGRAFTGTFFGAQAGKSAAQAPARTASPAPVSAPKATLGPIQTINGNLAPATTPNVASPAPAPLPNGRRSVQSSILDLGAPARRMDAVAQEVFNVVRSVNAIVQHSNVSSTGGLGASAEFQLRVPSQNLSEALNALSHLRYASVVSRTDNTTDVNNSYLSLQRRIAAAEATLTRLRARLAAATADSAIASLHAQIAAEQATLARLQGSIGSLNRQISFSNLYVSVQATAAAPGHKGSGGFGLHKAGHDALRVLEVTAGVALIALAALLPVGLLAALIWWVAATAQRRRRERALDAA